MTADAPHTHDDALPLGPPATPGEVATALDLLRASLAVVLAGRKTFSLRVTPAQRARVEGVTVRLAMTTTGIIEAWLEPSRAGQRHGVIYLGPYHPGQDQAGAAGATVAAPAAVEAP